MFLRVFLSVDGNLMKMRS